jgi:hypothetical protein
MTHSNRGVNTVTQTMQKNFATFQESHQTVTQVLAGQFLKRIGKKRKKYLTYDTTNKKGNW